jgi:hypothetical protein
VMILTGKDLVLTPAQALMLHAKVHAKPAGALAHRFVARK